ncbi:MAG: PQQ-binding-like beta-propeller repeat protein [Candidatus Cloacimonetes bacterium]|nr:PQQ-binding-like beta-propeller repeat protein [Candidatus Cloacimonadota bacterium]MBS3767659.1 PQQ-binding-like beta-propeller repeat protein [Candidatus Cloacimonadota bacterium]
MIKRHLLITILFIIIMPIIMFATQNFNQRGWTIVDILEPDPTIIDNPYGLSYGDGYLWVADDIDGTIYQLDPSDASIVSSFPGAPESNHGLAYDGTYFWASGDYNADDNIYKLDDQGNVITTITNPGGDYSGGMTWKDGYLWLSIYYPNTQPNIHKVDPSDGSIVSSLTSVGTQPQGLAFIDSTTIVNSMDDNDGDPEKCTAYDVEHGSVLWSYDVPTTRPRGLAWDGDYLYLVAQLQGTYDHCIFKIELGGGGTPEISVPVDNHDFGNVVVGDSASWDLTINNVGTGDLIIDDITFSPTVSPLYCDWTFPDTISASGSHSIPIIFQPDEIGELDCIATIFNSDLLNPEVYVDLYGDAVVDGPYLNLPDSTHAYGLVRLNSTNAWDMPVHNAGDELLVVDSIYTTSDDLYLNPDINFPMNVGILDTEFVKVWFSPSQPINYDETIYLESNTITGDTEEATVTGYSDDVEYEIGMTLWNYLITTSWDNSPKAIKPIPDLTGDGVADVIVCSEDNYVRALNGNSSGTADLLWETEVYSGNVFSYRGLDIIKDINDDGYYDVIIATTGGDRSIIALSGKTGYVIWKHDTHEYGGGGWVYQVNCRYDYNDDGHVDVLAATGNDADNTGPQRVYCLDAYSGDSIWEFYKPGAKFSTIGIRDVNGDNIPDAICGASNLNETVGSVYGIDGATGSEMWQFVMPGSSVWALEQLDDITGDGIKDVIAGDFQMYGNGPCYAIDPTNGDQIWSANSGGQIVTKFSILDDVNNDGYSDVGIGHSSNSPYALVVDGYDGSTIWNTNVSDQPWNIDRIGDVSGDGINDLIVGTSYTTNFCYYLDGTDGSVLESIDFGTPVDAIASIPDIVGDNSMEMIAGGRDGAVYCFSGGIETPQGVNNDSQQQELVILHQNYPNPFCYSTNISFTNKIDMINPRIEIFNIKGQHVTTLSLNRAENLNNYQTVWNGEDKFGNKVGSGIYMYKLVGKNHSSKTRKMIMVK